MELEGRVALITGASRGIGQGIARSMAEAGADIVVNYQRNKEGAEQTVRDVQALGRKAIPYQANVQEFDQVKAMVDKAIETFGKVDILVNNAGQHYSKSIMAEDAMHVFHDIMYTHVFGSFYCTQAVLPHMIKEKRGDIHFISSLASKQLWADEWAYASAKSWMETFVKTTAKELSGHGIRVNAIAPTIVESDMGLKLVLDWAKVSDPKELYGKVPFDRLIQPRDVGNMSVWLASDKASHVSGQVIWLDCGIGPSSLREFVGKGE
ncbi:MAG: SDR family oxidoreductase [Dehalococcoidia bacterium]